MRSTATGDSSANGIEERPRGPATRATSSNEFHDWQLDSTFDSKNLTTTRDLDNFMATLGGVSPLVNMSEALKPYARQLELDIDDYLNISDKDMQSKCVIAQEILRHGIERSPELFDELYLQLMKHLRGSNRHTSVRGWELMLLAACASRPTSQYLEPVNNFVHSTSHAKVQWPTTVSILAKRAWTALKHNSKPGRRVNVPSVGEIANVLSSKAMKVQITFVDGSNKWLFYDWTTTVSSAVEQLASQIGLKNYSEYTLFEVRKVPKKLDADGVGSIATLPPDSYLLLEDNRRIADVLHDYEVRGAQNKLLLKRKRFDASEADFSKPQFIALTEAHQAALDEKVAEVANLTLRLREMSGKVMWFEAQQGEHRAEMESMQEQLESTEARSRELEVKGVSSDTRTVIEERDALAIKVRQLEAEAIRSAHARESFELIGSEEVDWKPLGLVRKLAQKQEELQQKQVELDALRGLVSPEIREQASQLAAEKAADRSADLKPDLADDVEADVSEKEALYELLRLQTVAEDEHKQEVSAKDAEIEHLKQMLESLARRSKTFSRSGRHSLDRRGSAQLDDSRELRKSLDNGSLSNVPGYKEQLEIATAASIALEGKMTSLQDVLDREMAGKADLEHELLIMRRQLAAKEASLHGQERELRVQLNGVRAEAATVRSRLKSREAALAQATLDLEELHKEGAQLRSELETKDWDLEVANTNLATAVAERDALAVNVRQLKAQVGGDGSLGSLGSLGRAYSGDVGKQLQRKDQEVAHMTEQLVSIIAERDAALEKLAGIQQLMFGLGQGGAGAMGFDGLNGSSRRPSMDREGRAKSVNDNCPLEIGKDPRRESIGGASAPTHLKGVPPLRVLPEDKRSYGTRHPLFTPTYAHSLNSNTPEKYEKRTVRQEASSMLSAADARRRLHKLALSSPSDRPAPNPQTTPRMTSRINSGTHLLGLLSNMAITRSHESLDDPAAVSPKNGRADGHYSSELLKTSSSIASQDPHGRPDRGSIWNTGSVLSTTDEADLHRAALKPED